MLLGARRRKPPYADSMATASTDAPQDTQQAALAASQLGREGGGAASAAGAEGSATRTGSWRSLGGGGQPPAAAASQHSDSGGMVVLDVRNGYEWDAGHFQGAERPSEASLSTDFSANSSLLA